MSHAVRVRLAVLALGFVALAGAKPQCPPPEPGTIRTTDRGPVEGLRYHDTDAYLGIPYAAPPVGDLRWRPPEDVTPWTEPLATKDFKSVCPQPTKEIFAGPEARGEDCLYLNVWTPADPPAEPLPVMLWLHGGSNVSGSASFLAYDGRPLSEAGDVVVVTINYRLGSLGFMAHEALSAESPDGVSGNYGLLDQIAALQWVQRNAAAFGGDPNQVTLFGESAGGTDTCVLLTSPLAAGLFDRAIVQSGRCGTKSLAAAEADGAKLADAMGCTGAPDVATCMRAVSQEDLMAVQRAFRGGFAPAVDGHIVPMAVRDAFEAGAQHPVPVIMGGNRDEEQLFLPVLPDLGRSSYEAFVEERYGDLGPEAVEGILALYPWEDFWDPREAAVTLTTDEGWRCPLRRNLRALVATHAAPVYRYEFTRVLDTPILRDLGAFHGLEIFFVFDTLGIIPLPYTRNNPTNEALIEAMQGYWTRFAHTGDPNGGGAVAWPAYAA
ncbi:MAG: carboxylesterase family protein, partial [Myxococcales bacterium]|nr:carboxylesterase family protein [Myxococcales bacterium]